MKPKNNILPIPKVTVKFARTLDGYIATKTGDSKWISSPESRRFAHKLRSQHDALLVGVNTVLKDDPLLDVRLVKGKNPLKIIVDSKLRTPLTAKVLKREPRRTIFAATKRANPSKIKQVEELGARVLVIAEDRKGRLDLKKLLLNLGELKIKSVLVEGGAEIISSFINQSLVNRVVIIIAPKIIGQGLLALSSSPRIHCLFFKPPKHNFFPLNQDLVVDIKIKSP